MKHGRVYITSSIENEMIHLKNNLRDIQCFKLNIIEYKIAGTISWTEEVIIADYLTTYLTIVYL